MPYVLVPPQVSSVGSTRSVPCSMRCTGRPRPIPNDDSTRLYDKVHRRDVLQRDQTLRVDAARVVHRETPPAWARLGLRPDLSLGQRSGSAQPQRHRRRTQAPPGLAGYIEHRR